MSVGANILGPEDLPPAIALIELVRSSCITQTVYVAARLRIPDLLAGGAKRAEELARETETHAASLARLLRGLAALGLCEERSEGSWTLTPLGGLFCSGASGSLRDFALFWGGLVVPGWSHLLDSVRTGKTAAQLGGAGMFDRLNDDPKIAAVFNRGMVAMTTHVSKAVLEAYDFGGFRKVVDVGGGYGELLATLLKRYPRLEGVVFDLPHAAEGARRRLDEAGVAARAEVTSGDFFQSVPAGADAYLLKTVIHDWDDERSVAILRSCRRAIATEGKLLLIERIRPERIGNSAEHRAVAWSDLNMLVMAGGRERTRGEYAELFRASGFTLEREVPTASFFSVIQGTPV